jgi:hypothetical protein
MYWKPGRPTASKEVVGAAGVAIGDGGDAEVG